MYKDADEVWEEEMRAQLQQKKEEVYIIYFK